MPMNHEKRPSIDKNDSIEKALTELSMADDSNFTNVKHSSNLSDLIAAVACTGSDSTASAGGGVSAAPPPPSSSSSTASVPPSSSNIETFYKEVQRYEKMVNGLTTKTLNGTTPLEIKWKELNELLEKDAAKRTVSISKLFPEKNRNMLSVPYDHSRVLLPTETDNYINAAHIRVGGSILILGGLFKFVHWPNQNHPLFVPKKEENAFDFSQIKICFEYCFFRFVFRFVFERC